MKESATKTTELCFECSNVQSNCICQECKKVYCKKCFILVHKAKIMKFHRLITLDKCEEVITDNKCYIDKTKDGIKVSKLFFSN